MMEKVLLDKVFNNDTCFHFTRSVNLYNIEMNGLTSVPEKRENMTKNLCSDMIRFIFQKEL